MDHIYSNLPKTDRFYQILWEQNPVDKLYVYWISGGKVIKPAILKNVTPFDDLEMYLQRRYGEQDYFVMIRRGKKMLLTGKISIGVPLNFTPELDIRLEIESLREKELNREPRSKRIEKRNRKAN